MERVEHPQVEIDPMSVEAVEAEPAPCSSKGAVDHRVVEFDTIIHGDGRIEIGPINDEDWERVGEKIMTIVIAIAGGKPIGFSDCLDPQRMEAMAQRLAARVVTEGA
jgi:hypothetical protein